MWLALADVADAAKSAAVQQAATKLLIMGWSSNIEYDEAGARAPSSSAAV